MNLGWIEIVFFYGIAVGLGIWQIWKTDRQLKRTRAEREAREAQQSKSERPDSERK